MTGRGCVNRGVGGEIGESANEAFGEIGAEVDTFGEVIECADGSGCMEAPDGGDDGTCAGFGEFGVELFGGTTGKEVKDEGRAWVIELGVLKIAADIERAGTGEAEVGAKRGIGEG